MKKIKIANTFIGSSCPVYFIAELSANHNNDFDLAVNTIKAMKDAGANAVKVQTFTADTLTIDSEKSYFQIKNDSLWDGTSLYKLYENLNLPWEWHKPLQKLAHDIGLDFFSTPTDKSSADFLKNLKVPAYKIASFEITDIPLIKHVASNGKPVILSTGIANNDDIFDAINACLEMNNDKILLLKCTSAYPTPWEEVNLNSLVELKNKYNCIIGLSDHTMGYIVPLGAVALGAKVVEKHFILDRNLGGADSSFSMNPKEFKQMVEKVRILEKSLGSSEIYVSENVKKNRQFSRSLFVVQDMKKGEVFTEINIRSIRPGYGMKPKYYFNVIGKRASVDIERGTPLDESLIKI